MDGKEDIFVKASAIGKFTLDKSLKTWFSLIGNEGENNYQLETGSGIVLFLEIAGKKMFADELKNLVLFGDLLF